MRIRVPKFKLASFGAIFIGLGIALWGFSSLKNVETQYSVRQFLPDHHPSYEADDRIRMQFQLSERPSFFSVVRLNGAGTFLEKDRIERLRRATNEIQSLTGVRKATSIANLETAIESGNSINVGNLLANTPEDKWAERFLNDPMLTPALLSKDARLASLVVEIHEIAMKEMTGVQTKMREILKREFPDATVEIGGAPAIQSDLSALLNHELGLFVLLSAVACAFTIFLIFKNLSAVLIPFTLNAICNLAVLGWMAQVKIPFTVMSTTVPIMIFVTVITMCTHLMLRVNEELREKPGTTLVPAVLRANKELFLPNFLGPLTTLLGFLTLLITDVPLMRQYGWTVIGAVSISWALTQALILPFLMVCPPPRPRDWTQKKATWLFPILKRFKPVVISVTVATLLLGAAGGGLQWTALVFDDLPKGHEARNSTEAIDQDLGGAIPFEVVLTGGAPDYWNDPAKIQKLDTFLKQVRTRPEVGSGVGLPEFLKSANLAGAKLPETRQAAAEIVFLYGMAETNPLVNFLTADGRSTRLALRVRDIPANKLKQLTVDIENDAKAAFPQEKVEIAGMATTVHEINNSISAGLIFDFWQALLITSVTLVLVFRSWRWAAVACLPNIVPPIALLGFLGLTGTPIKPIVAMIFSVVLGLAFGNTVYMIQRLRTMQRDKNGYLPSKRAFYLEGNPCMISTLIVASGFAVFLFSDFSINQTFGTYVLISVAAGVVGDVMYLPSFLKWFPQFVRMKKPRRKKLAVVEETVEEESLPKAA